jgi:hypothetical protein
VDARALPPENNNLMSQGDELKLQRGAAVDAEREQGNERVDRIAIMHPDGMATVPEIPQSLPTVHSFAQGHDEARCGRRSVHV